MSADHALADAPIERAPVLHRPAHIRASYTRLALVTSRAQLDRAAAEADDCLIVSCDWLLSTSAAADGLHCVHYELGLAGWETPRDLDTALFIRANDWVYDEDEDMTLFDGVSLGKTFNQLSLMCLINFERTQRALTHLIETFSPREILFYDFQNDINILNPELRTELVRRIAAQTGVAFVDAKAHSVSDSKISESPSAHATASLYKKIAVGLYSFTLENASRVAGVFFGRRPKVLIMVNTNMSEPLLDNFDGGVTPVFWSRTPPKRIGFIARCIARGVRFVSPIEGELDAADRDRLKQIRNALDTARGKPATPRLRFLREFAFREIAATGKLEDAARDYRQAARTLARLRPVRIVVDGVRGRPPRAYLERAKVLGIPADYIWHSPLTPQNFITDALGGDPRTRPLISRCLSWGPVNEQWLDDIGAKMSVRRVGSPWGGRDAVSTRETRSPENPNILVLQYTPNVADLVGLNSNMYASFVDLVRELTAAGHGNIRYKLHPGPGRWKVDYFRSIADAFGIEIEILKREPFEDCLNWADIVIGPLLSGAQFETLAHGLPYFALFLPPHKTYPDYYKGCSIYTSSADAARAINDDREEMVHARRQLLNAVCAADSIENGARAFWEALREGVSPTTVTTLDNDHHG